MRATIALRIFLVVTSACCPLLGCTGDPGSVEPDVGVEPEADPDGGSTDAGPSTDAGVTLEDAGPFGQVCSFNRDCRTEERCECTEEDGCACAVGQRGTGQLGIDACTDGNDCASSLCLEGPNDALVCSGPCEDESDCEGAVPVCADIAFVGRICVRTAP